MSNAVAYFDGWAAKYDRDLGDFGYTLPALFAHELPRHLPGDARILDIGIGTGLVTASVKTAMPRAHITGVDESQRMLDICRARGIADDLRLCDAGSQILPYADASFDAAICTGVLEFIANPVWMLGQMARVLKAGGFALLAFETIEAAAHYKPGIIRGVIRHTPECATVRRVHYAPWLQVYNKYLHSAPYIAQLAERSGLILKDRQEVVAYTRPNHGAVAHDVLVFRK